MNKSLSITLYWFVKIIGIVIVAISLATAHKHMGRYQYGLMARPEVWGTWLAVGCLVLFLAWLLGRKWKIYNGPPPSPARIVFVSLLQGVVGIPLLGNFITHGMTGHGPDDQTLGLFFQCGILVSLTLMAKRFYRNRKSAADRKRTE